MYKKGQKVKPYPKHQDYRAGCKVSWLYYASEQDARTASDIARFNGRVLSMQGFEYGYCSPGELTHVKVGPYAGLFEVCIP